MRLRSVCATAMSAANNAVIEPTQVTAFRANETLAACACAAPPSPALRAPPPPVEEREEVGALPAPSPPVGERAGVRGSGAAACPIATTLAGGITGCGAASINGY